MAWGVLELSAGEVSTYPPGTGMLEDVQSGTHDAHVVLLPQPIEGAGDPLLLSPARKNIIFLGIVYGACITGVIGPLLVPAFSVVAAEFGVGLADMALSNGALILGLGVSAAVSPPLADYYGRRGPFLASPLIMLAGCIWAGFARSYPSFLASRVFQGFGMGPFFSVAGTQSINDIFFVHQRGRRAGWWNFAVLVSINVTPIISGYLIVGLEWRWSFWILAIANALAFVLTWFCIPETMFDRLERNFNHVDPARKATSWGSPNILLHNLVSPWKLLLTPKALWIPLWACAMWSVTFSWVIIQGSVADQIFGAPPYNLSPDATGLVIGVAPLIGSILGTMGGGWLSDLSATLMATRNGGLYEPEFRLTVMLPTIVTIAIGTFGLGSTVQQGGSLWASATFLGFINFGVGSGCTGIVAYSNDAFQGRAGEVFGLAMLIKSAFAFGISFMLNDYLAQRGALVFFSTFGGLTVGVILLTIPIYVFGKRLRAYASSSFAVHSPETVVDVQNGSEAEKSHDGHSKL